MTPLYARWELIFTLIPNPASFPTTRCSLPCESLKIQMYDQKKKSWSTPFSIQFFPPEHARGPAPSNCGGTAAARRSPDPNPNPNLNPSPNPNPSPRPQPTPNPNSSSPYRPTAQLLDLRAISVARGAPRQAPEVRDTQRLGLGLGLGLGRLGFGLGLGLGLGQGCAAADTGGARDRYLVGT